MQTQIVARPQCSTCSRHQQSIEHMLGASSRPSTRYFPSLHHSRSSRRQRNGQTVTQAFAGAAALSTGASLTLSGGLVSFFSLALGSLGLALLLADQTKERQGPNPECGTCEGTGVVPCVCKRWSDDDFGCSICRNTGVMACPSCGGGGTAVPLAVRAEITRQPSLMDHQQR